ncbi:mechanosensitive ion channel family protein [Hellea sp.]|nr:mechanosensitive ion channel family protein [Hellea sp.]MDA9931798.1 mechanosensitive ion channel family protein [bacterium]MDA8887586.1 mechanosensitive ion channel family protein [Hellea sp.]MDB4844244.1 mechanosensitive ion channel family protein [Hellea sp.]MDC0421644.1 mechanosensitive ion channel family protein [Hellea sp.]MDC0651330.1 mechanosensitive ion channel family protein [Hellea sp.]
MEKISSILSKISESAPFIFEILINLTASLFILIIGWLLARVIRKRLRSPSFGPKSFDETLRPVVASGVFYAIMGMSIYAFLTKLGIPATSLLAVFGAMGLAVGLALKDTLSNIASGVMLLFLRPLQVGDFVYTDGYSGSVEEIGLFATTLKNIEGIYIYVPNSEVWSNRLQNYTRHTERQFRETIGVGYESDLKKTQEILLNVLEAAPGVKGGDLKPECYIASFGDSAIMVSCRCWVPADQWMKRTSDLRIEIKEALDKSKIEMPFPQRVLHNK